MRDVPREALALARQHELHFFEALDLLVPEGKDCGARLRGARRIIELMRRVAPYKDERDGVRAADLREWFSQAEALSRELQKVVLKVDEHLQLYSGFMFGWNPLVDSPVRKLLAKADIGAAHPDPERNRSGLYGRLQAFEAFCKEAPAHVPRNQGGARTLDRIYYGSPKMTLVKEAADAYTDFWTDITATYDGRFYRFAASVYELVTGKQSEGKGAGLKRYVEFAAPRYRELAQIGVRIGDLAHTGMYWGLTPEQEAERAHLRKRVRELDEELFRGPR